MSRNSEDVNDNDERYLNEDALEAQNTNQTFKPYEKQDDHEYINYEEPAKPDFSWPSIRNYTITRFTQLFPSKQMLQANLHLLNPIPGLRMIGGRQWLMIFSAFWAWCWDAYDFFSITLNVSELAQDFDRDLKDITWGITIVLMLRFVGGFVFGYFGDRYGRKWPLVINMTFVCILEIGTGFIKTYEQFLGVRAVYGIMLGGVYGNAAATALDDCPTEARGFISGLLQQGYAFGYLLAVVFKRAIADNSSKRWRAMFWFGAGVCFLIILFRALLPETKAFQRQKEVEKFNLEHGVYQMTFKEKAKKAFKAYWLIIVYMILLVVGFSFMSHGSQDLYPTLLTVRYEFSDDASTVTNCVANLGAIAGGIIIGHLSNFFGRRVCLLFCVIGGGAFIYPAYYIDGPGINAGAFFIQFMVQGAWGVMPVHMSELAPPDFRAFVVGISYQLGNLVTAASTTIESTIGAHFPIISPSGKHIEDYARVMAIFVGAVFAYNFVFILIGPEHRNQSFETSSVYEFDEKVKHEEIAVNNEGNYQFENTDNVEYRN